jgi:hypothetical protein
MCGPRSTHLNRLLPWGLSGHLTPNASQATRNRLDELPVPNREIENREVGQGVLEQVVAGAQLVVHCGLVQGSGGSGFRRFRVQEVQVSGFRRFRVQGSGFRVLPGSGASGRAARAARTRPLQASRVPAARGR